MGKAIWSPAAFLEWGGWIPSTFVALMIGGIFAHVEYAHRDGNPERDDDWENDT
jgi:hypothetical protein